MNLTRAPHERELSKSKLAFALISKRRPLLGGWKNTVAIQSGPSFLVIFFPLTPARCLFLYGTVIFPPA